MENENNSLEGGVAAAAICSQKRATPDAHRAITRGANECWYRFVIRQKNEVEKLERDRDEARELLRDLVLAIGSRGIIFLRTPKLRDRALANDMGNRDDKPEGDGSSPVPCSPIPHCGLCGCRISDSLEDGDFCDDCMEHNGGLELSESANIER